MLTATGVKAMLVVALVSTVLLLNLQVFIEHASDAHTNGLVTNLSKYNKGFEEFGVTLKREGGPPKPTGKHLSRLAKINWEEVSASGDAKAKFGALELLSTVVQEQLRDLQHVAKNACSRLDTILCGHYQPCGLACQVHHRAACLMISYALSLPLIHNEYDGWAYSSRWSDVFQPLGSSCEANNNTYRVRWNGIGVPPLIYRRLCARCAEETISNPLKDGLPVPGEIARLVQRVHSRPWLWWIGQFMKYTLRLRHDTLVQIKNDRNRIGIDTDRAARWPIVGCQIRRTDKVREAPDSIHPISKYFEESTLYHRQRSGNPNKLYKAVFIASDDHVVLEEARRNHRLPEWRVFSFPANVTHSEQPERSHELYSIVRDLIVLSECDFIVCGFSSNICRLLLEMLSFKHMDPWHHIKSLDGEYTYLYEAPAIPENILRY